MNKSSKFTRAYFLPTQVYLRKSTVASPAHCFPFAWKCSSVPLSYQTEMTSTYMSSSSLNSKELEFLVICRVECVFFSPHLRFFTNYKGQYWFDDQGWESAHQLLKQYWHIQQQQLLEAQCGQDQRGGPLFPVIKVENTDTLFRKGESNRPLQISTSL